MQDDFETVPSPDSPNFSRDDVKKSDSAQEATTLLGPGTQEATTLLKASTADAATTTLLDSSPSDKEDLEQSLAYQSLMKHRAERKKKRIVKIAIAGVLALVAIVAVAIASSQPADDTGTDLATASVTREDFVNSVTVNGAAQPVSSVIVNPEVDGTIDQVLVKEGDTVEAGQTLFTLKNDDLDKAVREANQQVKEAQAGVSSAQTTLDSANNAAARANADVAATQAAVDEKTNAYNALAADPSTDTEALAAAKSDLDAATSALSEAQSTAATAPDTVAEAKNGLSSAQLTLSSAQDAYNEAVKATEKRTVTAPSAGAVIVMNAVSGAVVAAGTTDTSGKASGGADNLIQIADLSQMRVSVQVNEADISKIQVGQKATVTFSALPDVTCEGEVQSIATVATGSGSDSTDSSGSATYAVDLLIAQPDPRIKPGMTASVEIVAQEVKDALTVPATAVTTDDAGNATVTVVTYADDGSYTTEDVPVQVIAQSSTTAAITGDIHEDDLVLLGGTTTDDGSDATDADATADETVTYG